VDSPAADARERETDKQTDRQSLAADLWCQIDADEFLRDLELSSRVDAELKRPNTFQQQTKYGSPTQHRLKAKRAAAARNDSK
jgi:hypothetical protein